MTATTTHNIVVVIAPDDQRAPLITLCGAMGWLVALPSPLTRDGDDYHGVVTAIGDQTAGMLYALDAGIRAGQSPDEIAAETGIGVPGYEPGEIADILGPCVIKIEQGGNLVPRRQATFWREMLKREGFAEVVVDLPE